MSLLLINAIPFAMVLLFLLPQFRQFVSYKVRAWLSAGVMLLLFFALISYFPDVQARHHVEDYGGEELHKPVTHLSTVNDDGDALVAVVETVEWVPELGLELSFYLDGLSLLFALIVTGVGAGIFLFAGFYFDDEDDRWRFMAMLFAFAGSMLGLVLSGNLITLFIMWEGTSITSFLLIGFKGSKYADARFGAQQAFVITGLGALALIVGLVLLAAMSGDVLGTGGLNFNLAQILQADSVAMAAHPLYIGAVILLALGAFTKSAQFPFHFWLPGAMAAPTPASAYLHSATMVKAGIYLLLRLYPPMHNSEFWTMLLVTVGIGTMFIAAVIALFQRDLKGLLAYSTVSWLGALVGMIGLPEYAGIKAALVGIIAHALYKAALFLAAGTIDHNTGTRIIDKLGGLRKQMPVVAGIVIVSALSMAGMPIFFGFVAKEVLLAAWLDISFTGQMIFYGMIIISAALTGTVGFILIWDVFFKKPTVDIHYHASAKELLIAPVLLAIGTATFGLFLDPPITFVEDLVVLGVPKAIDIHLLPKTITDPIFLTSLGIIAGGFIVFLVRRWWLPVLSAMPLPSGTGIYKLSIQGIDFLGDQVTNTQHGRLRYYLVVIFGAVVTVVFSVGLLPELLAEVNINFGEFADTAVAVRAVLLLLISVAALFTVLFRSHLNAALSLGVLGYAVGALFLIEPAPDVSLVQFLIETLATVLIIIMLGRISLKQREEMVRNLWEGTTTFRNVNVGVIRDILIAGAVGLAVFMFALTALTNRSERGSITQYHLENTYEDAHIEDVVGAIVADYRGMDTVVEGTVFAVAALGVLTLLTRGLEGYTNPFVSMIKKTQEYAVIRDKNQPEEHAITQETYPIITHDEFADEPPDEPIKKVEPSNLKTPFTQFVARIVLPLTFLVAISHLVNGGYGPGDGFTAGAIAGLGTALWFVVFGYDGAKQRLSIFAPHRLLRFGLFVIIFNGLLPIIFNVGGGSYLAHVNYGKLLGIGDFLERFGLELSSGLFFEVGIAFVVFGGISLIMEAIAHPRQNEDEAQAPVKQVQPKTQYRGQE